MEQLIPVFTSSPSLLCSIKGTSIHTWARQFFGTLVRHLGLLAFQMKLLFLAPQLIDLLAGCAVNRLSHSVNNDS